jgi:hypothetical protein
MSLLSRFLRSQEGGGLLYWCQGCDEPHAINVGTGPGPRWGYNGNPDKPTFTPSVLVRTGHFSDHHKPGDECWCTYNAAHPDEPDKFHCQRCHTFITDGRVQFLDDCTHKLAGQTLDLPVLPAYLQERA